MGVVLALALLAAWTLRLSPPPLRIVRLAIEHLPRKDEQQYDPGRRGLLGERSFGTRLGDDVTVQAELSQPAYAYLIAFRPDGTVELCDPEDEDMLPNRPGSRGIPRIEGGRSVSPGRRVRSSCLCPGRLACAAATVPGVEAVPGEFPLAGRIAGRSRRDLAVRRGTAEGGDVPWRCQSGKGAKARGGRPAVGELAQWLRNRPGVEAVALEAFAVEPADAP